MMSQLIGDIITTDSAMELSGRMQRNVDVGKSTKEKLSRFKSSGIIASLACYSLGHGICKHVIANEKVKIENTRK